MLVQKPVLGIKAPRQAYCCWCLYTGLYLVLVLPYSHITGITGISKGTGRRPAGGAPFPSPAEGLWRATPFQTVADSFQPRLQLHLTEQIQEVEWSRPSSITITLLAY